LTLVRANTLIRLQIPFKDDKVIIVRTDMRRLFLVSGR